MAGRSLEAQTISGVATFNNIGIEVEFGAPPAPGTAVNLFIKKTGDPDYRAGHPLSRVSSTRFAGSALQLDAGTAYSIRLESAAFSSNRYLNVTTRTDAFPDATNTVYHVSPSSGEDGNDGQSEGSALRTLGEALSRVSAGDTILLHDGTCHEGDLSVSVSGTPTQPIVIRNAPDATPVLNGTDTNFVPSWTVYDAGNAVYSTAYTGTPRNAYLNGGHLLNYTNLNDLVTNRWDQSSGYHADGSHLYVRFPGGAAPGGHVVTVPEYTTGITIDQRANIHIIGVTFCYYGYGQYHRGIYIDGGDSNLVDGCLFHHNGIGVAFKRAANFNTVQNSRFTESPITSWSWHAVKSGGAGYEAGGVVVYSSPLANEGNVIRRNVFTNMFDGSNLYSDDLSGPTRNMDYHDNLISGCGDDCVETDGVGSNNRIYGNVFRDFLTGVSVAPCAVGPTYVFRNVFSGWHSVGEYEGYPFKFNVSSSLTIDWVYIYHNTCHTDVSGQNGFLFKQYSDWTNIVSRNNIYSGTDYALSSWSSVNPVDFDYDNLTTTHGTRFVRWAGTSYATVNAFYAATGQEQHGVSFVPGFVDASAGDYRLGYGSPLIDKGIAIPGVNDGFVGTAPDIGAYEFGAQALGISNTVSGIASGWGVVSTGVYRLQYARDLMAPAWSNLGSVVTAATVTLAVMDPSPPDTHRFYRLKAVSP
jgi:hypothetical protein